MELVKHHRALTDNLRRRYWVIKGKIEGFAETGEDRQQKIQRLIMKESCERVRLEGATGERDV